MAMNRPYLTQENLINKYTKIIRLLHYDYFFFGFHSNYVCNYVRTVNCAGILTQHIHKACGVRTEARLQTPHDHRILALHFAVYRHPRHCGSASYTLRNLQPVAYSFYHRKTTFQQSMLYNSTT
jgi:hypothetical protein